MGIGDLSEVCKLRCIEYRFASIAFVAFDTQHKSRMPRLLCWCRWWFRMPPSAVLQRVQTIFRVTSVACHRRRAVRARPLRHMPDIMYQKGGLGVFRSVSVLRQVNLCRKVLELFFRIWSSVRHLTARIQYRAYRSFQKSRGYRRRVGAQ